MRRLGAQPARRSLGRGRGIPGRRDGAPRRRPHPLDPQRRRARADQQRHRRSRGGRGRQGDVPARRRAHARSCPRRSAASPYRPGMGLDRACVPGPNRRYRDRGDGGEPSEPHHAQDPVRGNLPRARPGRAGDRRQGGAVDAHTADADVSVEVGDADHDGADARYGFAEPCEQAGRSA